MKKRTLIILFVVLTLLFSAFSATVAYAADGDTDTQTSEEFTKDDTIKLIVIYCLFGLSLVVGIPAIKAVNKRKKHGYIDNIVKETESIANKVSALYENRTGKNSKKDELHYSIKISTVADMALTTYTEKQVSGYFDLFNELNDLKTRLAEIGRLKENEKYDAEFLSIVEFSKKIADDAKLLADNEKIIRKYSK